MKQAVQVRPHFRLISLILKQVVHDRELTFSTNKLLRGGVQQALCAELHMINDAVQHLHKRELTKSGKN